jgi:hypothetical protein
MATTTEPRSTRKTTKTLVTVEEWATALAAATTPDTQAEALKGMRSAGASYARMAECSAALSRGGVPMALRDCRRTFTEKQKDEIYHREDECCARCGRAFTRRRPGRHGKDKPERWEGYPPNFDHLIAWADGGRTEVYNGGGPLPPLP